MMTLTTRAMDLQGRPAKGSALTALEHDKNIGHLDNLVVNVESWGVVGDGLTDNGDALLDMQAWCEANRAKSGVTIYFPPGDYKYSKNWWVPLCKSIQIVGYGATLQCVGTTNGGHFFTMGSPFYDNRYPASVALGSQTNFGSDFATVAGGSTTVTLLTGAETANFAAGDLVLLHGYDQQGPQSFPPNARYFEWNCVASVASPVITLEKPLQFSYSTAWRSVEFAFVGSGMYFGQPQIKNLNEVNIYPNRVIIKGIKFLANPDTPNVNTANGFMAYGYDVTLEDLWVDGQFWPQFSRRYTAKRCYFTHTRDLDKMVDTLHMEECETGQNLETATGMNNTIVDKCRIRGFVRLGSRRWSVTNSVIDATSTTGGALAWRTASGTYEAIVKNNRIYTLGSENAIFDNPEFTLTVTAASAGEFRIASGTYPNASHRLLPGMVVRSADWSKRVTITDMYADGSADVFKHSSNVAFSIGETLFFTGMSKITHESNEVWKGGFKVEQDHFFCTNAGPQYEARSNWIFRGHPFLTGMTKRLTKFAYTGFATKMIVRVLKAATAAPRYRLILVNSAGNLITVMDGQTTTDGAYAILDFVAGTTTFVGTWSSTSGMSGAFAMPILSVNEFRIGTGAATEPTYASRSAMPVFEISVEGASPIL